MLMGLNPMAEFEMNQILQESVFMAVASLPGSIILLQCVNEGIEFPNLSNVTV